VWPKLNVDENPRTGVSSSRFRYSTMLISGTGSLLNDIVGAQPKPAIEARLSAACRLAESKRGRREEGKGEEVRRRVAME